MSDTILTRRNRVVANATAINAALKHFWPADHTALDTLVDTVGGATCTPATNFTSSGDGLLTGSSNLILTVDTPDTITDPLLKPFMFVIQGDHTNGNSFPIYGDFSTGANIVLGNNVVGATLRGVTTSKAIGKRTTGVQTTAVICDGTTAGTYEASTLIAPTTTLALTGSLSDVGDALAVGTITDMSGIAMYIFDDEASFPGIEIMANYAEWLGAQWLINNKVTDPTTW